MKIRFTLAGFGLAVSMAFAQIPNPPTGLHVETNLVTNVVSPVPPSRMPRDIFPYWVAGVPGGIPTYPNCVNVMSYGAHADGVTDDSSAFSSAISACTNGGAVYVPAGTYLLNSRITFNYQKKWALRGAGPTNTILKVTSSQPFYFGGDTSLGNTVVSSGFSRGSSNLVVATPANVHVGDVIRFYQKTDDTNVVGGIQGMGPSGAHNCQMFGVYAVNGSTVTLDNIIYYPYYTSANNPFIESFTHAVKGCGIENLAVDNVGTTVNNFYVCVAQQCWIKNVYSTNATDSHIAANNAYQCEFRDMKTWYHRIDDTTDNNTMLLGPFSTDCLIENVEGEGNNGSFNYQCGATGNVFAYCYSLYGVPYETYGGISWAGGSSAHGSTAKYNLFEGMVLPWIAMDNRWGGDPWNTVFRCWMTRKCCYSYTGLFQTDPNRGQGLFIDAQNYYENIVGNIMSSPRDAGTSPSIQAWSANGERYGPDANVGATIFMHGNFDFVTGTTGWSNGVSRTLPSSFYLRSKPAWFGSLAWPAIGPDVNTSNSITNGPVIPAQARAMGVSF